MTAAPDSPRGPAIDLRTLARDMPLVRERALLELVSEIGVADVENDARGRERFFGRLARGLRGSDRKAQVAITGKILGNQRTIESWVRELSDQHALSDLAIAQMAEHLRELQLRQTGTWQIAEQARTQVSALASLVGEVAREIDARLSEHDQRLDQHAELIADLDRRIRESELKQAGQAGFDRAVPRWETAGAYRRVEWPYQVVLLAREVATGPCGVHEFATGDDRWRDRLVERILDDPKSPRWQGHRTLDELLESAWQALPDADRCAMIAELLGAGLPDDLRPPDGPLSTALKRTMVYAALPSEARPKNFTAAAVNEVIWANRHLPTSYTMREYVRRVVNEQGDGAMAALRAVHDRAMSTADG